MIDKTYSPPAAGADFFKLDHQLLAHVQSCRKGRSDGKAAVFSKINRRIDIAFPSGQLHSLDVLNQLTCFQALVFGGVLLVTVFTRRRDHSRFLSLFILTVRN
jgi:hypothetical protein